VELPGPHGGGGVHVRLHRRAALTVDGRAAHGLGPTRDERNHAAEVPPLLADLRDASELDVLDLPRLELVSRQQSVEDLRSQVVAADLRQRAVLLADRRAHGVDDVRSGHDTRVEGVAVTATERKLLLGGEW